MHMISTNGAWLKWPTLQISTVGLPNNRFESAIQTEAGTEPIESYDTMAEAIIGHLHWCRRYGANNHIQ